MYVCARTAFQFVCAQPCVALLQYVRLLTDSHCLSSLSSRVSLSSRPAPARDGHTAATPCHIELWYVSIICSCPCVSPARCSTAAMHSSRGPAACRSSGCIALHALRSSFHPLSSCFSPKDRFELHSHPPSLYVPISLLAAATGPKPKN